MRRIVVGTAGHIDHGKSALVRALTGTDPDRLPEEKARGITIDLGFAHASWDGVSFSFVDVPGHERFVRTMVAGAQGVDLALLVVASDDGVMPQTREHLAILSLLEVRAGVVARTKSDLVDDEMGLLVDEDIRALVSSTFLERAPVVPVSAVTGQGLDALRAALAAAASLPRADRSRRVTRLSVDRAFTMKGFGVVVTGTLDGGTMRTGDRLTLLPEGTEVRVRRIETHGEEREDAIAGERTSLNLAGVERADLRRGQTLVAPDVLRPSSILTTELELLATASHPLRDGDRVRLHHGTADVAAKVNVLSAVGQESAGGDAKVLAPGNRAYAQLFTETPLAALRGDRFVIRRPSPAETLGGGRVLDTGGRRLKRSRALPAHLAALASVDEAAVAELFLKEAGASGLDAPSLARRLGRPLPTAERLLERLVAAGSALRIAPALVASAAAASEMARRVERVFGERKGPVAAVPRGELLSRIARGLPEAAADGWLQVLAAGGKLALDGDSVAPPGTRSSDLSNESSGLAARIAEAYRAAAFEPPSSADLARVVGTKPAVVEGLVSHLLKTGTFVRLSPGLVVHRESVESAAARIAGEKGKTLPVGGFRDLLGLSRKTLIPLLEYFDTRKITRRAGDQRVVL